jgi:hypothetical protein
LSHGRSKFRIPTISALLARRRHAISRQALDAVRDSVFFDAQYYLETNPDVAAKGHDPALHYLMHGGFEGRDAGPYFSSAQYLKDNPDVAAARINPLVHYEMDHRRDKPAPPWPGAPSKPARH